MLKFIYKVLLVSVLSGSLMMMDFTYKGFMIQAAHAETMKTDGIKEGSGLMATLTMTAVGFIASRLIKYKTTPDMLVAAAGGVAFLAGEVLAAQTLKKVAKDLEMEIKRNKDGKIERTQVESIEKLKASYVAARKAANTKKTLQMAAAAAFAAAGVMAYFFAAQETTALTTCSTAVEAATVGGLASCISASAASCAGPQFGACFPPLKTACNSCAAAIKANHAKRVAHSVAREAPAPSMAGSAQDTTAAAADTAGIAADQGICVTPQSAPMSKAEAAACPMVSTTQLALNSYGVPDPTIGNNPVESNKLYASIINLEQGPIRFSEVIKKESSAFERLMDYIIPGAHASLLSPMGIASSAAIAFVMATNTALAIEVDTFLLTPKKRGIVFGVLAGLTFMAVQASDQAIQKIDSNIAKIDAILNSLHSMAEATTTKNPLNTKPELQSAKPESATINSINADGPEDMDMSDLPGGTTPCFSKETNGKCDEFGADYMSSSAFGKMPDAVKSQVKEFTTLAQGFNRQSRISKATLGQAGKIANGANALRSALNKAKLDSVAKFKKVGKNDKAPNPDESERKFSESMQAAVVKQLKKQNMSPAQMLASFGTGSMYNTGGEKPDASMASLDEKRADIIPGVIDIGAPGDAGAIDFGAGKEGSETADGELTADQEAALAAANAAGGSMDDYDLKNDITKDEEKSIFELITNRYQKSGYPRLFKRKTETK